MITLNDAIYVLNPSVVTIRGDVAYDADENIIEYDMAQAETKLAEMQAEEFAKQEAQITAKESAMAKLAKLGLTEDEIKALIGQ
jgi:DeoR/GlpR family transcriptional regulator of sugar metabolism